MTWHGFAGQSFPATRMRRFRATPSLRRLVAEHRLAVEDLIWPVFVHEEDGVFESIPGMPGVVRFDIDALLAELDHLAALGLAAVAVFPVVMPRKKTPDGAEAWNPDGLVQRTIKAIKAAHPSIAVMADCALDPFTTHGHDGILRDDRIDNDLTVAALVRQALSLVEAGVDVIAPSDMMDGRIGAIRQALEERGHVDAVLLSYAAKYASCFYGPFRSALGSAANLGSADKTTYQMQPANSNEALREVALDLQEGADAVMIKPGMPYLDILHRVKSAFGVPTFVYQVSGEYAALKAAAAAGALNEEAAFMEALLGFKRAGADAIVTYWAPRAARLLGEHR